MEVILCKICSRQFNDTEIEPRLLKCGHYFCFPCIKGLEVPSKCPECQAEVSFEQWDASPVNFAVLNILLSKGSIPSCTSIPYTILENSLEKVQEYLTPYALYYDQVSNIRSLLADTKKLIHEQNFMQILQLVKDCNRYLDSVTNLLNQKEREFVISKELKDFACSDDFIRSIIFGLDQHEVFFAAHRIGKEIKYGKLTVDDRFKHTLFIHSLTETNFKQGANIVWDIKSCVNEKNLMTFLDIPYNAVSTTSNRIVFVMTGVSALATQFIKICSGECDKTYKGAQFTKNSVCEDTVLSVTSYLCNDAVQKKPIDYDLGLSVESRSINYPSVPEQFIDRKCLLLKAFSDGSFKILKNQNEKTDFAASSVQTYKNIIGVTAVHSGKNCYAAYIKDCGIAIASSLQLRRMIFYDVDNEKFRSFK